MSKLSRIREYIVAEMTGKVDPAVFDWWSKRSSLYGTKTTVNYARNDYDLFRSIYWASCIEGKGGEYLLAAGLGKPIVNSAIAFALGLGFTVGVSIKGTDTTERDQTAAEQLNEWIRLHQAEIYDWGKHAYRDGDAYLYIDELGDLDELDAKNVTVMLDVLSSQVVGYDVEELVEERTPGQPRTTKYKILKEYRTDSVRFTKFDDNGNNLGVFFEQVFTVDGTVTPTENQEFIENELVDRQLPVIHFANDPEPRAIYGNSEYQNLLIYFRKYHDVLENGTKGVIYNSTPIPWLKGVKDTQATAENSSKGQNTSSEDRGKVTWDQDSIIFLSGDNSGAGFLQADGIMTDVSSLLEKYFYMIVEASETPEFVFGAAVQSSKASTETQLPVLLQKAQRKRTQMEGILGQLIKSYIDRQIRLSNPVFLQYKDKEIDIIINWPELESEDREIILKAVQLGLDNQLLSDRTALRIALGDKVDNIDEEIEAAHADADAASKRNNVFEDEPDRLDNEDALPDNGEDQPVVVPNEPEES
jgi:hypothetical protein